MSTYIDLLDRDRFAHDVPHEWFAELRRERPVFHHPEPDGPGFWVLTRHRDVVAAGRQWQTFSSDADRGGVVGLEEPTPEEAAIRTLQTSFGKNILVMDPPDHTRYRRLVSKGFTPRFIASLQDRIRSRAVQILEAAITKGDADFVVDVAAELPLQAIAELLGVPEEDRHRLFDWSNRIIGSEDPEYAVSDSDMIEAAMEMFVYVNDLAQRRRSDPQDDIVSTLVHAELDGDGLTDMDLNLFFLLLAVAGNETTRNTISHGMHALLQHPDQFRQLRADPGLLPTATEEMLRWASPVMQFRRNATCDTAFEGHTIKEGDKVSLWYISANRDEEVFADPYRFDIGRAPNEHISFGFGPHFCLGAWLARLEIQVLFEELMPRVGVVEQTGEIARLRSNFINGIKHLPVRFERSTA